MDFPAIDHISKNYDSSSLEDKKKLHALYLDLNTSTDLRRKLENIVFRIAPPTPKEYLDHRNGWITKPFQDSVYPYIKEDFVEILNVEKNYSQAVEYGSTRIGKSYLARMLIHYIIIYVHCLRHPQLYYGLAPTTNLSIYIMSFVAEKANQLLLKPIYDILDMSPRFRRSKFQDKVAEDQYKDGLDNIYWSKAATFGHLTLESKLTLNTGVDFMSFIGTDLLFLVVSEISFFIEKAGATHDQIFQLYTDGLARIKATVGNNYLGMVYLDSSANDLDNPIEQYILKDLSNQDGVFFKRRAKWEIKDGKRIQLGPNKFPKWIKTGETFKVCLGDNNIQAKIVDNDQELKKLPSNLIIDAPIDLYDNAKINILKFIKDDCGLPTKKENKFISDNAIISDIFDNKYLYNVIDLLYADASEMPDKLLWEQLYKNYFSIATPTQLTLRRAPLEPRYFGADLAHCVDAETEIFTQRGWLKYNELKIGDIVLSLDKTLNKTVWTKVTNVNIFPKQEREMLEINSRTHSSLSTLHHRWVVDERKAEKVGGKRRYKGHERKIITSEKLSTRHKIIRSAEIIELPINPIYSDAFVELVAWFWTEGCIFKNRDKTQSSYINLCQSEKVNLEYCKRIDDVLLKEYGNPVIKMERNGMYPIIKPQWRTLLRKGPKKKRDWYLNSFIGKQLINVAPNKVVKYDFILSLTKHQLEIFVKTSFDADRDNERALNQKDKERLRGLEMALILLGNATNSGKCKNNMFYVSKIKSPRIKLYKRNMKRIIYDDIVWCPTTETGIWFAKRNGKTFYTGNSVKGDLQGLTLLHKEWSRDLKKIIYVADFSFGVFGKGTGINLEAGSSLVLNLINLGGVTIHGMYVDTFQSKSLIQSLERFGVLAVSQSVDRTLEPYQALYTALLNKQIKAGRNIFLKNNLDSLIISNRNGKQVIDHSTGQREYIYNGNWEYSKAGINSKDVSDSLCQAFYAALNDTKNHPFAIYEDENRKLDINEPKSDFISKGFKAIHRWY